LVVNGRIRIVSPIATCAVTTAYMARILSLLIYWILRAFSAGTFTLR
jgi:hypothetical protein